MLRLILGLLFAIPVAAQTASSPGDVTTLPGVKVTAARDPAAALPALNELLADARHTPGGVTLINRDSATGRGGTFGDWLRLVPGVTLTSANSADISKISLRGSGIQSDEALGVQILLDGLVYNQGDGEANLEEIDLTSVAAAEVFRGASSLRYGGYVLGGAINFISATGRDRNGGAVQFEGRSFGQRRVHLSAGGVRGDFDGYAAFSARRSDGFRDHAAEHAEIFSGNFGQRVRPHVDHRVYWSLAQWHRRIPGDITLDELRANPAQADAEALEGDFRVRTRSLRVADKLVVAGSATRLEAGAFFHRRRFLIHDRYERNYRLGVTEAASDNFGAQLALEHGGTLLGRPHALTLGLAPAHELERSANFRNNDGVLDRSRRTAEGVTRGLNLPIFAESRLNLSPRLAFVSGAQFVHIARAFDDRFWTDAAGNQSAHQRFRAFNPRLALIHTAPDGVQFFANLARSFQPPSFDDLNPFAVGTNGSAVYTPLSAQHASTAELGARGRRGRFEWDLSVYHSRGRNELLELADAAGRDLGTVNAPRTRHRGIEFGLEIDLRGKSSTAGDSALTLRQSYTLNDFRFTRHPVYGGNRIAGLPLHRYEAELAWRPTETLSVSASLQRAAGATFADHANTLPVAPHTLAGLRASWRDARGFTFFLEARNLASRAHVAMIKPIADARLADADELRLFAPGAPRAFSAGGTWTW